MEKIKVLPVNFFDIPIDIKGGNIGQVGWMPTKEDFEYTGKEWEILYNEAMSDFINANEKVCFKNVQLNWESCDCGSEYGCSHPDYVYELDIKDENGTYTVEIQDEDSLYFENPKTKKACVIPLTATIGDFHRACVMCGIELELTDYVKSKL